MIATILLILLLAACTVSCSFWLVALGSLASVLKRPKRRGPAYEPMVSILKPVKGVDAGAIENFTSFCEQEYSRFELLFAVADPEDPAVALIGQLRAKFPNLSIRQFVAEPLGTNPKAASLHCLAEAAHGQVLAICDADIRVGPDFLRRVVAPLADKQIGLVTCLYRGELPKNLSARLEALHMDAAFAPSVALAWRHGTKVGLGAAVIMRRDDLERAGGYAGIADHLLDDYEIAARIAGLGLKIHLSDCPVACVLGAMHFPQQWAREVRWQRGIRVVRPLQYPGLIITFSLPLAIAAAAFFPLTPWALAAVPGVLAVRLFVAWQSAVLLGQRERRYLALLPVRDFLSLAVWLVAMFGRRVTWRGQEFVLRRDGRLQATDAGLLPDGLLARAIRRLDAHLRRKQGIFEFADHPRCLVRINVAPAEADMAFADGTCVRAGEPVGVLHLWNEHLTTIPKDGADLRWAMAIRQRMQVSLRELAKAARHDPRLKDVKAFGGTAVFVSRAGVSQVAKMAARFGFEWIPDGRSRSPLRRVHDFFENFLVLGLQWAFNPAGMRGKGFIRPREPLWMSRETLMKRYHHPATKKKPVPLEPVVADG